MPTSHPTHILYHYNFSICSLFVRYAYALRGEPKTANHGIRLEERHIDLTPPASDQLEETFMCDINPPGKVPVLISGEDGTSLPDSLAICYRLAESYPLLMPIEHAAKIKEMLEKLHKVEWFSLTFEGKYHFPTGDVAMMLERMNREGIGERYYRALEEKMQRTMEREIPALKRKTVEGAIRQTRKVFKEVEELLVTTNTQWLLGTVNATILDAQIVVFVSRLQDIGRDALIPGRVIAYAKKAMQQEEWRGAMEGRQTIPPGGF